MLCKVRCYRGCNRGINWFWGEVDKCICFLREGGCDKRGCYRMGCGEGGVGFRKILVKEGV